MTKARLKYTVVLPIILSLGIPFLLIVVLLSFTTTFNSDAGGIFVCLLLMMVWLSMIFELRDKLILFRFNSEELGVKSYLGLGKEKCYGLTNLDGFQTSTFAGYRYIYVIKGKLKVAKISESYFADYKGLLRFFQGHLTDLGTAPTNIITETKDAFRKKQKQQTNNIK